MSTLTDGVNAIREVLKLTDDVKRAGETLKDLAHELREHDRRITRLEAQWDTARLTVSIHRGKGAERICDLRGSNSTGRV